MLVFEVVLKFFVIFGRQVVNSFWQRDLVANLLRCYSWPLDRAKLHIDYSIKLIIFISVHLYRTLPLIKVYLGELLELVLLPLLLFSLHLGDAELGKSFHRLKWSQ